VTVVQGLSWSHEPNPTWDPDKQRVVGSAPEGVFDLSYGAGDSLPGDWWAVRTAPGEVVGYGWLDATWGGDAEILLAVDAGSQQQGVGSFVLEHLEQEAADRGLNYVYNKVRDAHPDRDELHDWLAVRGYRGSGSYGSDVTLRKRVGADTAQRSSTATARTKAEPAASHPAGGYDPAGEGERGPGHEESGGYVDVEDHQY
jgi:GNAT superfamily N-acetyltransferase